MLDAGSEAGGDRLAATASRLYREAGRLIAGRVDFEPTAVDYALAVIFDVADACALASAESTQYPWPTRRVIELEIRLYELADWATRLGFTLDLRYVEEGFPAEAMRADELPSFQDGDFAAQVAGSFEGYDRLRMLLRSSKGARLLQSQEGHEAACADVSSARGWLVWARQHVPDELQLAAAATLYIARGFFVATTTEIDADELFPTDDFLRSLLSGSPIRSWLAGHGADLPDWVAD